MTTDQLPPLNDSFRKFTEPIAELVTADLPQEYRSQLMLIAYRAWNAVSAERSGARRGHVARVRRDLRNERMSDALLWAFDQLVERKRAEPMPDNRIVERVTVALGGAGGAKFGAEQRAAPPARAVASVPGAVWKPLYELMQGLYSFAPWRWMYDSQVFGVRDRKSGEVAWCSVLGNAEGFIGLAIYLGDVGFDQFRRMRDDTIGDDSEYGHDGYLISFGDRRDMQALDLERIKAAGVAFRGRGAWPEIDRWRFARQPQLIDESEVTLVVDVLQQTLALAMEVRIDEKHVDPDLNGHLLVRAIVNGLWTDTRVAAPPRREPDRCEVDHKRIEELLRGSPRVFQRFEYHVFPMKGSVSSDDGSAYIPTVFMVVDSTSGAVLRSGVDEPENRQSAAAAQLLDALEQFNAVPLRLAIRQPELAYGIQQTLDALGVQLEFVGELPALERARRSMERSMSRSARPR